MEKSKSMSDYISVLLKWKKFVISSTIIVIVAVSIYAFSLPNDYKATASVMIPPESNSFSLGGLGSLLSSGKASSSVSAGAKLLGIGGTTNEDVLLGLLNSHLALVDVINEFNLYDYYEVKDRNIDKTIKAFKGDLSFGPNEYGLIEVAVVNQNATLAANIANRFVHLIDSLNITFNAEQAKSNRQFIEQRYLKNVADIKTAEDSLYKFQKKYGVYAVPQQLEVVFKAAGEIEGQLLQTELLASTTKQTYGETSPEYLKMQQQVQTIKSKISELKNSSNLAGESNILVPFKNMPEINRQYFRLYRELEIQNGLMQFILPMFEQAKVEEQKSVPTVLVVDKAYAPQVKYGPKRSLIIGGVTFLFLAFFSFLAFIGESVTTRERKNQFEENEYRFYSSIKRIFRIK